MSLKGIIQSVLAGFGGCRRNEPKNTKQDTWLLNRDQGTVKDEFRKDRVEGDAPRSEIFASPSECARSDGANTDSATAEQCTLNSESAPLDDETSSGTPAASLEDAHAFPALKYRRELLRLRRRLDALKLIPEQVPTCIAELRTFARLQSLIFEKVDELIGRVAILETDTQTMMQADGDINCEIDRLGREVNALDDGRRALFVDEDIFVALLDDLEHSPVATNDELRQYMLQKATSEMRFKKLIWPMPADAIDSQEHEVTSVTGPVLVTPLVVVRVLSAGYVAVNGTTIRARVLARHRPDRSHES